MRNPKTIQTALDAALLSRTPLLRVGRALAKLELLRPTGGADDRALAAWDAAGLDPGARAVAVCTMGGALAGAAWARARGVSLHLLVHGPLTHEAQKIIEIWGPELEHLASPEAAQRRAQALSTEATLLVPLDGKVAANAAARSLGAELLRDLDEAQQIPSVLVAPAGARAALLGALQALRARWPAVRAVALVAASREDELPELPPASAADLDPSIELRALTRAEAAEARAWLTRTAGLLASHAAAAAVQAADELGGVALVTSTGEREFSLDARPSS